MYAFATKPRCPYCSFQRCWKLRRQKLKCKRCRKEWSRVRIKEHIRATPEEWSRCITVFLRQRAARTVAQEANIGYCRTVKMVTTLRQRMCQDAFGPFAGTCEADETFIGGQWKNKRRWIRRRGTKKGHGTSKVPIVGVYARRGKHVAAQVLAIRNEETVIGFIRSQLLPRALLYTDGYKMNRAVRKYNVRHFTVDHDAGEFVRGAIHTNGIEGFWGYLKRHLALVGGIQRHRLPLFVGEFVWRYNQRHLTREQQHDRLLKLI